jgi:hypothetical protein
MSNQELRDKFSKIDKSQSLHAPLPRRLYDKNYAGTNIFTNIWTSLIKIDSYANKKLSNCDFKGMVLSNTPQRNVEQVRAGFESQQQPFSQNAKLQEYLNPTDKKSTSLIFTKSNEIYAKEIKLHSGILAGIAKLNTFVNLRNPTQASIDFSVISNNTQKNLDKVAKIITKVVPQNHIYGINYGTINSAKPHYPYLVSGMQKMFGMDLENDSEKQGKIFVYSGDRPTDPEFALNAHRNGIQSIGILHDVANLVSSPKTLIAKQQMLDYSKEIPIFVLSGSINDTVQDLANLEIGICSAIDKHNIDFAKLSEKDIITDATIKTTNLNVA